MKVPEDLPISIIILSLENFKEKIILRQSIIEIYIQLETKNSIQFNIRVLKTIMEAAAFKRSLFNIDMCDAFLD